MALISGSFILNYIITKTDISSYYSCLDAFEFFFKYKKIVEMHLKLVSIYYFNHLNTQTALSFNYYKLFGNNNTFMYLFLFLIN